MMCFTCGCLNEAVYVVNTACDTPLCIVHKQEWLANGDWQEHEFSPAQQTSPTAEIVESANLHQPTGQVEPCQHDYKEVGSGFLMQQWQCSKCGDVTDDYGVSNP